MSVNYHAYQCRGYLLQDYEAICEQWRGCFQNYQPERAVSILKLDADEYYLYLQYFQKPYRLRLKDGVLEKKENQEWSDLIYFNEAMACYHLLYYVKDMPLITGKWVPNTSLGGAASRSEMPYDPLFTPFARRFTGRCAALDQICRQLSGIKRSKGDLCYEFEAFPQVHLQLIFYDADEDFPAQANVLVDDHVTDFIHFETTGCLISDLFEQIEKTDTQDQS